VFFVRYKEPKKFDYAKKLLLTWDLSGDVANTDYAIYSKLEDALKQTNKW
jgi:hypothetical protein